YSFYQGVMHSHARLTYTKVSQMLEHPDSDIGYNLCSLYSDILPQLHDLYGLYKLLRKSRTERGAIDFETTETRVIFDAARKIEEIVPVQRNDAHKIVEECMLCANVATARFQKKYEIPSLYRVHDGPSEERLAGVRLFLAELGLQLGGGNSPKSSDYQALLASIADRPDSHVIQMVMLRSLSQAVYSPEENGHFGLGFPSYTHFTSPIRRYPDLIVHRAIKSVIHGANTAKDAIQPEHRDSELAKYPYDLARVTQLGQHCSMAERRADDATRDVMAWLKCEYLREHVGSEFDGVIAAVTPFGFFVELSGVYIEGLVHVSTLSGDFYHHDAGKHRLIGERTSVSFRLGDTVRVKVMRVGLEDRKIDLELVSEPTRRQADRDALGDKSDKGRKTGKGDRAGKGERSGKSRQRGKGRSGGDRSGPSADKSSSAREQLVADAAREAGKKPSGPDSKPAGKKRSRSGR
ncbi:VacB/RNase II family 3'-5' exoribonuclease, partial [uncultured Marinobacter sp.]|uniref:ribonuclease R family protein n=1 Tax=uncultured Marinobacter sp. TaxID=187379 RepID=UPI0030DACC11